MTLRRVKDVKSCVRLSPVEETKAGGKHMTATAISWLAPGVPELLLSASEGGTNPKAPARLVSGGTSLWEMQFSAAVAIFKPEV